MQLKNFNHIIAKFRQKCKINNMVKNNKIVHSHKLIMIFSVALLILAGLVITLKITSRTVKSNAFIVEHNILRKYVNDTFSINEFGIDSNNAITNFSNLNSDIVLLNLDEFTITCLSVGEASILISNSSHSCILKVVVVKPEGALSASFDKSVVELETGETAYNYFHIDNINAIISCEVIGTSATYSVTTGEIKAQFAGETVVNLKYYNNNFVISNISFKIIVLPANHSFVVVNEIKHLEFANIGSIVSVEKDDWIKILEVESTFAVISFSKAGSVSLTINGSLSSITFNFDISLT